SEAGVAFGSATVPAPVRVQSPTVTVGVRPEDLVLVGAGDPGLSVVVDLVEELGADGYLYGHTVEGDRVDIVARVDGRVHPGPG
ncbi:TOBE domain-containing protein, partial [Leucobacter japonicus]